MAVEPSESRGVPEMPPAGGPPASFSTDLAVMRPVVVRRLLALDEAKSLESVYVRIAAHYARQDLDRYERALAELALPGTSMTPVRPCPTQLPNRPPTQPC